MTNDMDVLRALPVLGKIWNTRTLSDYFMKTVEPLTHGETVPEKKMMIAAIFKETERLYGSETAVGVCDQITSFPVVETGTHLAFLRDYDTVQKDDLRSRLNQNVVISSALMRHVGQKYHVGVYGSNVSLAHPCSGGFFQLGDDIFPVTTQRQTTQVCLYDAPAMEKSYFNEAFPLVAKLKMLQTVLTDDIIEKEQTPRKEMMMTVKGIATSLLAPIGDGKCNYTGVEKQYQVLKASKKSLVEATMQLLSAEARKKYGYTFADVDKQYQELGEVFNRPNLKLPDQVALAQSKTINGILDGTGIRHVSVDAVEVVRQFLISSLENKESLWYNIFNDSEKFKKMHQTFIGIRGSWKENESPFDYVGREKGFAKCLSLPLAAMDHKPETLLPLLKDRKIVPSCGLIMLAFQSADIMAHGGFFQTTYADKIKKGFVGFLQEVGENSRAEQLQKLPVDMALLSLAVMRDTTGNPMKLSEISRMPLDERQRMMDKIPNYPSCRAVVNALPVLRKYLASTAPGYVETEASHAESPRLVCHFNKTVYMSSQAREREIRVRFA